MADSYRIYFTLILCVGCGTPELPITLSVSETAGFDREWEYVTTKISLGKQLKSSEMLMVTDVANGSQLPVQVLKMARNNDEFGYTILFPLAIAAKEIKKFDITIEEKMRDASPVQLRLSADSLSVENPYYKAYFSTENDIRGGQINGIELKDFGDKLLKRGHIAMHWAPNFSKPGSESYFNMEDFSADSRNSVQKETYRVIKERSGVVDSVPEINVEGRYEFYADLPYFLFESTMTMKQDVELDLLRNDEMTMDSLFTHVVFPRKDGSVEHLELYDEKLDVLEGHPIKDDADWVAFYNEDKGYGFGSIRLKYDNTDFNGRTSPTYRPYTKISKASGNGRYWNRILTDTIQAFPKGSRYYEKNAYLVFKADEESPEKQLSYYAKRFKSPLKVSIGQND